MRWPEANKPEGLAKQIKHRREKRVLEIPRPREHVGTEFGDLLPALPLRFLGLSDGSGLFDYQQILPEPIVKLKGNLGTLPLLYLDQLAGKISLIQPGTALRTKSPKQKNQKQKPADHHHAPNRTGRRLGKQFGQGDEHRPHHSKHPPENQDHRQHIYLVELPESAPYIFCRLS